MSRHAKPRYTTPIHAKPRNATPGHVHATPCHTANIPRHATPRTRHAIPRTRHATPYMVLSIDRSIVTRRRIADSRAGRERSIVKQGESLRVFDGRAEMARCTYSHRIYLLRCFSEVFVFVSKSFCQFPRYATPRRATPYHTAPRAQRHALRVVRNAPRFMRHAPLVMRHAPRHFTLRHTAFTLRRFKAFPRSLCF